MAVYDEEVEDGIESRKTTETSLSGIVAFDLLAAKVVFMSVG